MTVERGSEIYPPEKEAQLYGRYLIGVDPPKDIVERYIKATRELGIAAVPKSEAGPLKFCLAHPWSIPFLDAAAGLLRQDLLVRKRIYVMAAVLEASTRYTEDFLPSVLSTPALFSRLVVNGFTACIKMVIGIPMLLLIGGRRRD